MATKRFCSRAVFSANAEVAVQQFEVCELDILIAKVEGEKEPTARRVIQLIQSFEVDDDPMSIALSMHDTMQLILATISLVGVCAVTQENWLSTTPADVATGDDFWVITPTNYQYETPAPVVLSQSLTTESWAHIRKNATLAKYAMEALRSKSAVDQFRNLVMILESIADEEAQEMLEDSCPHCNQKLPSRGKATWRYIRELLIKDGIDAETVDACRSLRAKTAHGRAPTKLAEIEEFSDVQLKILGPVLSMALERTSLVAKRSERMMVKVPLIRYNLRYLGKGEIGILPTRLQGTIGFSRLPRNAQINAVGESKLGAGFDSVGHPQLQLVQLPVFADNPEEIRWSNTVWNPIGQEMQR